MILKIRIGGICKYGKDENLCWMHASTAGLPAGRMKTPIFGERHDGNDTGFGLCPGEVAG
jgi:hypothetical protein